MKPTYSAEDLITVIRELVAPPAVIQAARVIAVDKAARQVTVMVAGDEAESVASLMSIAGGEDGLVTFPSVDSDVLVGLLGNNDAEMVILATSSIDGFELRINGLSLIMDGQQIKLGGEAGGGLVLVAPLVAKLNALQQQLNNHQHTVVVPAVPATVVTTPEPVSNPPLAPINQSELASKTVVQG